jgi:hypothetical protein
MKSIKKETVIDVILDLKNLEKQEFVYFNGYEAYPNLETEGLDSEKDAFIVFVKEQNIKEKISRKKFVATDGYKFHISIPLCQDSCRL